MNNDEITDVYPGFGSKFNITDNVVKMIELIKVNCSESLSYMKKDSHFLYRGMSEHHEAMFVAGTRLARKPLHSNHLSSVIIDNALIAAGMTAIRSNSIYCTTDSRVADTYGTLYYIFPRNGFNFTWTTHVDLFSTIEKVIEPGIEQILFNPQLCKELKKFILHKFEIEGFEEVPFEVYEWAKTVYWGLHRSQEVINWLRNYKGFIPDELRPHPLDINHVIRSLGPRDDNFTEALNSGNEIMIHGIYYALRQDRFRSAVEKLIWEI